MSSDEEVPNQNFSGFDSQPVVRPSRVAAVGGGSATDKHRENRAQAQNLSNTTSGVKGSGIVDQSSSVSTGGVDPHNTPGADLGSFGAHGRRTNKRSGAPPSTGIPAMQPAPQPQHHQHGGMMTQLNTKDAEEMERKMRQDLAKATANAKSQEDVFEAEYAALATQQQQVQPAAPATVTDVADDDFDF